MTQDVQLIQILIDDIKGLTDAIRELNQIVMTLRLDTAQDITELRKDVAALQRSEQDQGDSAHHWQLVLASLGSSLFTVLIQHAFHFH